jgi:hypothetical protein
MSSKILIPFFSFLPSTYFSEIEPIAMYTSCQAKHGVYSNTYIYRPIDPDTSDYVSILMGAPPSGLYMGVNNAFDNDPNNFYLFFAGTDVDVHSEISWDFYETEKNANFPTFLLNQDRGVYLRNNTSFIANDNSNYLEYVIKIDGSILAPDTFYGDGTAGIYGIKCLPSSGDLTMKKTIMVYLKNQTVNSTQTIFYERITGNPYINNNFFSLWYGALFTLPTNEVFTRDSTQKMNFDLTYTTKGTPKINTYWGMRNRRNLSLSFTDITATEKDNLVNIFKLGRGGAPLLYMADTTDTDTWIEATFVGDCSVTEPYAGAFNVNMQLEEI